MTDVARVFAVRKEHRRASVAFVLEVAPDESPQKRRRENCFGIVAIMRRNGPQLVALRSGSIAGRFDSAKGSIPNNNIFTRVTGHGQSIDNRADHVMVSCEKFTAGRRDLDPDLVARRDERSPGLADIRLPGYGQDQPIDHGANDVRISPVITDRVRIMRDVYNRWSSAGPRHRRLRKSRRNGAEAKKR